MNERKEMPLEMPGYEWLLDPEDAGAGCINDRHEFYRRRLDKG